MIRSVNSYNLKPLQTFPEGTKKRTTITSFDDMLKNQTVSQEEEIPLSRSVGSATPIDLGDDSIADTDATKKTTSSQRTSSTSDSDSSKTSSGVSSSSSVSTTSASSMKKTKYDTYFKEAAAKYNVSESLLKAVAKAESDFNAKSVSSAGAMGVMQLMPDTVKTLGIKDPYDPRENIMGGAKCIADNLATYKGDVKMSLAAYNAGSGAVRRCGGIPSYTRTYINRVLSYKEAYETANSVG